jgi:hypothetical protein
MRANLSEASWNRHGATRCRIVGSALLYAAMPTKKGIPKRRIYKVTFRNDSDLYEVYCRRVGQAEIFGFIEIEGLLFGEKASLVVDPSEEKLKLEFAGVERTMVPLHAVIRIDAVEKSGSSKVHAVGAGAGKVTPLPTPIYTPKPR